MKQIISAIAIAAILVLGVGGCAQLTAEQKARIEEISKKNETLAGELSVLYTQARQGVADPAEIVVAIQKVNEAMAANYAEIKKIQAEGEATSWIAGAVGLFGRSALHLVTKIPLPGPLGMILQMGMGILLGGSETKQKVVVPEAKPATT